MSRGAEHDQDADRVFTEALAKVFNDQEAARQLASRAGFPVHRMPAFQTPLTFWTKVVEEIRNGVTLGGVRSLIEQAAELYPGNPVFSQLKGSRELANVLGLLDGCDSPMTSALEAVAAAYVSAIETASGQSGSRILFDRSGTENRPPSFFIVAYAGSLLVGMSDDVPSPARLRRALARLAHHDFGLTWQGFGTLPPPERQVGGSASCRHSFTTEDDLSMIELHRYLSARAG